MFRKNTSKFIDDFVFKGNYPKSLSLPGTILLSNFLQDNSTSDWSPRQAPGTEVLDVRSPASVIPPLQMTSLLPTLQKTLPPLQKTHLSCADPCRPWNPCNLWDAQLKHLPEKSVRRGAKCTEFTDVFNLLHVLHCNRIALHCATALFWTLNCMSATWSIRARYYSSRPKHASLPRASC